MAEIEFYSGTSRLTGAGFGTVGSRSGNPWENALDGNVATAFDGPLPDNVSVGIDAAADHRVSPPVFTPPGGTYASPQAVTLSSGNPALPSGTPSMGAIPQRGGTCTPAPSRWATAGPAAQSSAHIGNSLTDTIDGWLRPVAASGGFTLDYWRYTVSGIGTYIYDDSPTGGNGLESAPTSNIQTYLRTRPFDHISF